MKRASPQRRCANGKTHQPRRAQIDAYLHEAIQRIRRAFPDTRRIILFGSYAAGVPREDSDLDLFIEMPTQRPRHRQVAIERLLNERPCALDIVVKSPQEVRRTRRDFNPFLEDVLTKGRVLYAQARQ